MIITFSPEFFFSPDYVFEDQTPVFLSELHTNAISQATVGKVW